MTLTGLREMTTENEVKLTTMLQFCNQQEQINMEIDDSDVMDPSIYDGKPTRDLILITSTPNIIPAKRCINLNLHCACVKPS